MPNHRLFNSPLPQLLAGLVRLSFGSRLAAYEPLMSRRYAYLMLGRYGVELLVDDSSSTIAVKLYVANASVLLPQVCSCDGRDVGAADHGDLTLKIVRVVSFVLLQRFMSLQYELLAPCNDGDTFAQVA